MFCIIAFVVLSILGIFSASNRVLAREALECVGRRVTLRPCNTGFDEKVKAKILGVVIVRSERGARFLNKYFEVLAWIFFVLLMASSIYAVRGLYLFYTTGSCNGANSSAFCVFDPTGANNDVSTGAGCLAKPPKETDLRLNGMDLSGLPTLNPAAPDQIVMIGCYHCDYTRKVYPDIRALVAKFQPQFVFFEYPVKEKDDSFTKLAYCVNQTAPDKFWQFNDQVFEGDKAKLDDPAQLNVLLKGVGLDLETLKFCTTDPQTELIVQNQLAEARKTRFYGTPTIFINGVPFVGPKPYRVYAIALEGLLYWMK